MIAEMVSWSYQKKPVLQWPEKSKFLGNLPCPCFVLFDFLVFFLSEDFLVLFHFVRSFPRILGVR